MRIVDRKTFLEMPEGTLYCEVGRYSIDGMEVKGETKGESFLSRDLCCPDAVWTSLEVMLEKGESRPLNEKWLEDQPTRSDLMYLIYESADLVMLSEVVSNARKERAPQDWRWLTPEGTLSNQSFPTVEALKADLYWRTQRGEPIRISREGEPI